jgi:hypothetical protein
LPIQGILLSHTTIATITTKDDHNAFFLFHLMIASISNVHFSRSPLGAGGDIFSNGESLYFTQRRNGATIFIISRLPAAGRQRATAQRFFST